MDRNHFKEKMNKELISKEKFYWDYKSLWTYDKNLRTAQEDIKIFLQ